MSYQNTNPIKSYFSEALQILQSFMEDENNHLKIEAASAMMADCFKAGGKILSCGNGGSLCDAMHFAEEMSGRFREDRKALPALAISDPSYLTCAANDYGYAKIFSRYVEAFGKPGDILLALSTSGKSPNILEAVNSAKEAGMKVVALTGKDGGKLGPLADIEIRAPCLLCGPYPGNPYQSDTCSDSECGAEDVRR